MDSSIALRLDKPAVLCTHGSPEYTKVDLTPDIVPVISIWKQSSLTARRRRVECVHNYTSCGLDLGPLYGIKRIFWYDHVHGSCLYVPLYESPPDHLDRIQIRGVCRLINYHDLVAVLFDYKSFLDLWYGTDKTLPCVSYSFGVSSIIVQITWTQGRCTLPNDMGYGQPSHPGSSYWWLNVPSQPRILLGHSIIYKIRFELFNLVRGGVMIKQPTCRISYVHPSGARC